MTNSKYLELFYKPETNIKSQNTKRKVEVIRAVLKKEEVPTPILIYISQLTLFPSDSILTPVSPFAPVKMNLMLETVPAPLRKPV